jgi:hypothetical protein
MSFVKTAPSCPSFWCILGLSNIPWPQLGHLSRGSVSSVSTASFPFHLHPGFSLSRLLLGETVLHSVALCFSLIIWKPHQRTGDENPSPEPPSISRRLTRFVALSLP